MFVEEEDVSLTFLIEKLRNAFFEISDIDENSFMIKVHNFKYGISVVTDQKLIRITGTDRVANFSPELFDKLLVATNQANASIINVCCFILNHENDNGDEDIVLRVDQHISYSKGLILDQFVKLLRDFEEIDVHIYQNFIMPAVQEFEENHISDNKLLN